MHFFSVDLFCGISGRFCDFGVAHLEVLFICSSEYEESVGDCFCGGTEEALKKCRL
jgi:hypothetical protein